MTFTVTIIGADGSGKSTLARELEHRLDVPSIYLYMGVSLSSSNRMLPTTRLLRASRADDVDDGGPPDRDRRPVEPVGIPRRAIKSLRRIGHLAVLVSEEWYRQTISWWHRRRGRVVIYDRHFFIDYYAHDVTNPRTRLQAAHGWMLSHVYPKPGLVLFVDAPAEVLFARKGEGTVALLERRRDEYHAIRSVLPDVAVLDATKPLHSVIDDALMVIQEYQIRLGLRHPSDVVGVRGEP